MRKKFVIFGAGAVGSNVAKALSGLDNDVTLVDRDDSKLVSKFENLDIKFVNGEACDPNTLDDADIGDADIVLAVTDNDDTNILVSQLAYMFGSRPKVIARLRNAEYHRRKDDLFSTNPDSKKIPIDSIFSPEQLVTDQIMRLITQPGALQIVEFAGGKIQMVGLRAAEGGKLVGHKIEDLRKHLPDIDSRVAAIFREDAPIIPKGDTEIQPGDEVFFVASPEHIGNIMTELQRDRQLNSRHVMLVGAGNIGMKLARQLEDTDWRVKLIEFNKYQATAAAIALDDTTVIHGNASDQDLMMREGIESVEIFCSVTNDDEVNIFSAMLAKKLGAKRTIALINNSAFVELLENVGIDTVIAPSLITVSALLREIRKGDTLAVHSLRGGGAEAIETVVHGSEEDSQVSGRSIGELKLPEGTTVGAILRNDKVKMGHKTEVIEDEDHVILFVVNKDGKQVEQVLKLFEPGPLWS